MPRFEGTPESRGRLLEGEHLSRRGSPELQGSRHGTPPTGTPPLGTPNLSPRNLPRPNTPSTHSGTPPPGSPPPYSSLQLEALSPSRKNSLLPPGSESRRSSLAKKSLTDLAHDAKKGIKNVKDTSMKAGQKNPFLYVMDTTKETGQRLIVDVEATTKRVKDKTVSVSGHMKDATVGASQWVASQTSRTAKVAMEQAKAGMSFGEKFTLYAVEKISRFSHKGFTHVFMFLVLALYTALGALLFIAIEAPHENQEKNDIEEKRNNLLEGLWHHHTYNKGLNYSSWQGIAVSLLKGYDEQLYRSWSVGISPDTDDRIWTFWKAMFFCSTITTTIGYGHIFPRTNAGRALTIVYAILGIPIFLILMADFGKLFTRLLKALFVLVRKMYRTATCRRVRKSRAVKSVKPYTPTTPTPPLAVPESSSTELDKDGEKEKKGEENEEEDEDEEEAVGGHGKRKVREREPFLTGGRERETVANPKEMERNGKWKEEEEEEEEEEVRTCCISDGWRRLCQWCSTTICRRKKTQTPVSATPESEDKCVDMVDDNFNLPISLALLILLVYIMIGCVLYTMWEEWTYFEAFYFIFISMTTIGFGDYVPDHPAFMMMTTVYLVFGLALTAMCINIIQEKMTDTFRVATEKMKQSIQLMMNTAGQGEEGEVQEGKEVEVASVHGAKQQQAPSPTNAAAATTETGKKGSS